MKFWGKRPKNVEKNFFFFILLENGKIYLSRNINKRKNVKNSNFQKGGAAVPKKSDFNRSFPRLKRLSTKAPCRSKTQVNSYTKVLRCNKKAKNHFIQKETVIVHNKCKKISNKSYLTASKHCSGWSPGSEGH